MSNLESGQSANSSAIQSLTQRTTAAEGKIETNSQAISSVTGTVNAMLNRGENLANDFNFMSGSALWGVQGNTRNKVEFGDFGDGKPGVQMTQIDNSLYTGLFANQKAPLPHNTPRRYQVIVKAKGVSGAMNFMVRRFNYQGMWPGRMKTASSPPRIPGRRTPLSLARHRRGSGWFCFCALLLPERVGYSD
ncbi:hypothetical protein [Klebsiella aerogenes]|uniref:hypothetical protein n=1 Tax=Klebsiella aerogenes TaxID=548 RepID=UPI000FC9959C|nr:hypothetical protein [Klebsiella aerogenes]